MEEDVVGARVVPGVGLCIVTVDEVTILEVSGSSFKELAHKKVKIENQVDQVLVHAPSSRDDETMYTSIVILEEDGNLTQLIYNNQTKLFH